MWSKGVCLFRKNVYKKKSFMLIIKNKIELDNTKLGNGKPNLDTVQDTSGYLNAIQTQTKLDQKITPLHWKCIDTESQFVKTLDMIRT